MLDFLFGKSEAEVKALLADPLAPFADGEKALLRRCAAPRWFDRPLFEQVLRAECPDDAPDFAQLIESSAVEHIPGPQALYTVSGGLRTRLLKRWVEDAREEFAVLSEQLAAYFAAAGDQIEQLYHLIAADERRAAALVRGLRQEAADAFDMTTFHAVVRVFDERARLLAEELAHEREQTVRQYDTYALWAQEFYDTVDYLDREETELLFEQLLRGETHWVLQLYAAGGMGKSMFIKATIARGCLGRTPSIPCARIDFDYVPYIASATSEPWRMLLSIAGQLNQQLANNPFTELLSEYGDFVVEADRHTGVTAPPPVDEVHRKAYSAEVPVRVADLLAEAYRKNPSPILLVFDTLENLRHRNDDLSQMFTMLAELHTRVPGLRLILAGRFNLAASEAGNTAAAYAAAFGEGQRTEQLRGFTRDQARAYLVARRHLPDDERIAVMIEQASIDEEPAERGSGRSSVDARSNPFELALLADLVDAEPTITSESLRHYTDARVAYAIRRVVLRIENWQVRWMLRYGVIPRQLTVDFVEQVLVAPMREAMSGRSTDDNPLEDALDRAILADMPFPVDPHLGDEIKVGELWTTLHSYAAAYSWVRPAQAPFHDALTFNDNVRPPLRKLLRAHAMYGRLQEAAADYFTRLARQDRPNRALWLAEAVEHRLRAASPAAEVRVLQLIAEAQGDELGAVGDRLGRGRPDDLELSQRFLARSGHLLARKRLGLAAPLTTTDLHQIGSWLAPAIELANSDEPPLHPAVLAATRATLALRENRDLALAEQLCRSGLATPASVHNEAELRFLLAASSAAQGHTRVEELFVEAEQAASRAGAHHLVVRAAFALGETLAGKEQFEPAADAYRRAAAAARTQDRAGPACVALVRLMTATGQASGAAEEAEEALQRLRALGPAESYWCTLVQIERLLAVQEPHEAMRSLGELEEQLSQGATPPQDWVRVRAELRARIFAAQLAVDAALAEYEGLATFYASSAAASVPVRLGAAALLLDVVGAPRQARHHLDLAAAEAARTPALEASQEARWRLLNAMCAVPNTALPWLSRLTPAPPPGEPLTPGVQTLLALEALVSHGPGEQALARLAGALAAVSPPTYRIKLLSPLAHCEAARTPVEPELAGRLLGLLPGGEGVEAAPAMLCRAELARVLGRRDEALATLEELDRLELAQPSGERTQLLRRELYRALDRVGAGPARLPEEVLEGWKQYPDVAAALRVDHAERLLNRGLLLAAKEELVRAQRFFGRQTCWGERINALQARIEPLSNVWAGAVVVAYSNAPVVYGTASSTGDNSAEAQLVRLEIDPTSERQLDVRVLGRDAQVVRVECPEPLQFGSLHTAVRAFTAAYGSIDGLIAELAESIAGPVWKMIGRQEPAAANISFALISDSRESCRLPWELLLSEALLAPLGPQSGFTRVSYDAGPPRPAPITGRLLLVQPSAEAELSLKRGYSPSAGSQLDELYHQMGIRVQRPRQLKGRSLSAALVEQDLAVVHLVGSLRERSDKVFVELDGGERLSPRDLAALLPTDRPPLLLLDAPPPPDPVELTRQLFLRNQFASELITSRPDLSILGMGLAGGQLSARAVLRLASGFRRGETLGQIVGGLWSEGRGSSVEADDLSALMLRSTALFTNDAGARVQIDGGQP